MISQKDYGVFCNVYGGFLGNDIEYMFVNVVKTLITQREKFHQEESFMATEEMIYHDQYDMMTLTMMISQIVASDVLFLFDFLYKPKQIF